MPALRPPLRGCDWNTLDLGHAGCRAEGRTPRHRGTCEYLGLFKACQERPVAFTPTEPTKGLNFLPLHLQPYTLTPNPDNLTSHHRSAPQTGALVPKGLGRPRARGWLSAGCSSHWNQSSGDADGRRLSGLWSSCLKNCPKRVATAGCMQ